MTESSFVLSQSIFSSFSAPFSMNVSETVSGTSSSSIISESSFSFSGALNRLFRAFTLLKRDFNYKIERFLLKLLLYESLLFPKTTDFQGTGNLPTPIRKCRFCRSEIA
ncbi:unnamed protein product, partial [Oikopleura dioica]